MARSSRLLKLSLLVLFLVSCSLLPASPSLAPTVPAPTESPAAINPTATLATSQPGRLCEIVAESEVTVYNRPSLDATVFGEMSPGLRVVAEGRTADGWLGFDPGVAQAANVGIFRNRWVEEGSGIRLEGACGDLPELIGPPAGVCFTMPMGDVDVYAEPDRTSGVIARMTVGDYAAVIGRTEGGWAWIDLSVGNTELDVSGWIEGNTLNLNGPCEELPVVEP